MTEQQVTRSDITCAYNRMASSIPLTSDAGVQSALRGVLDAFDELDRHMSILAAKDRISMARANLERDEALLEQLQAVKP